jgi:hypothetical protein
MTSPFDFIVKPLGDRYSNIKKIEDKELLLNTEISNHEFVNRVGVVKSVPSAFKTEIEVGDNVIVHHNVFRRMYDVKGREKNSRSFLDENNYLVQPDQVYAYKRFWQWKPVEGYCFVQPIKTDCKYSVDPEKPLTGIVFYGDEQLKKGDVIGFSPGDEYEFVIENTRLYRVMKKFITIKYEREGNEKAYNPSWAQSS